MFSTKRVFTVETRIKGIITRFFLNSASEKNFRNSNYTHFVRFITGSSAAIQSAAEILFGRS